MDTEGLRRSPRRHASGPSRSPASPVSVYDKSTATDFRQELKSRGIPAPAKATKRQLFQLLSESDSSLENLDQPEGVHAVNGSSKKMIPLTMSDAEREEYQRRERTLNGSGPGASQSAAQCADTLLVWKRPIATMYHFLDECRFQLGNLVKYLATQWQAVLLLVLITSVFAVASVIEGPHTPHVNAIRGSFLWYGWWVCLGILSSVGLGTGLHTFILYLGPHIAAVTLASWSCMSVDFPSPPYPDELLCPEGSPVVGAVMSIWTIMWKVRVEAMMWGAGTAIGELPPYFVARAARLAGQEMDAELEEAMNTADNSITGRAKHFVHRLIQRVGFWGIFLAASIPNPLFDLAGITCGHFLVPFPTFFGATLLGKAVVKMHIQQILVIFLFTKSHFESLINLIGHIPAIGAYCQKPFLEYLEKQKTKYHRKMGAETDVETSLLSYLYGLLVIGMILYFVLSILHSMAKQNAARRASGKLD